MRAAPFIFLLPVVSALAPKAIRSAPASFLFSDSCTNAVLAVEATGP